MHTGALGKTSPPDITQFEIRYKFYVITNSNHFINGPSAKNADQQKSITHTGGGRNEVLNFFISLQSKIFTDLRSKIMEKSEKDGEW